MRGQALQEWVPYCGAAPVPAEFLLRWNLDPVFLLALGIAGTVMWRQADRKAPVAVFAGLMLFLYVSPFCALSSALFSARVTHHVLLAAVAAPMLAWSISHRAKVPGSLAAWTMVQATVFWFWHAPPAYEAALSSDAVFWAMQLTLLGSATGFWIAVRRASPVAAVAALLVSTVQMGLLGAILTFSARAFYAPHYLAAGAWGLSPLEDQQMAGLIMWAPAAALYILAALFLGRRALADEGRPA